MNANTKLFFTELKEGFGFFDNVKKAAKNVVDNVDVNVDNVKKAAKNVVDNVDVNVDIVTENNVDETYTSLNNMAKKQNQEIENIFSTYQAKQAYQNRHNQIAITILHWMYALYILFAITFLGLLIFAPKGKKINWKWKIIYVLPIIIYPFIASPILFAFRSVLLYVYNMTLGRPVTLSNWAVIGEPKITQKYSVH